MNIAQIKKVGIIDSWVDTSGQILEIKEQKTRTTKNRLMAKVKIGDETDQIGAWLYIDTNSVVLNQIISIRAMLKEWNNNRYLDYGKIQSQQQTAQNAAKSPQNALQSTNNKKDVDWDAKELRDARINALNNATKLVCLIAESNKEYTDNPADDPTLLTLIEKSAEVLVNYIYKGLSGVFNPGKPIDDIPF